MKNEILRFIILILGVSALYFSLFFKYESLGAVLSIVLGILATTLKINMAKKGYKNIISTIGSYTGVVAVVTALIELFL